MKKIRIVSLLLAITMLVTFAGCTSGSKPNSSDNTSASSNSNGDKTLKLVVAAPMTGDSADWGKMMWDGASLAVKEINVSGGVTMGGEKYTFTLEKQDDKGDAKEGANLAQKLVTDKSIFSILGFANSSVAMAAQPIYEAAKMPVISGTTTSPALTQQGWKYFMRDYPHDNFWGPEIANYAHDLGYRKFAVIYPTSDSGVGLNNGVVQRLKELGDTVVASETLISQVDKDFSAQLTNIKASGADCLLLLPDYTECGLILKQKYNMGLKMPVVTQAGTINPTTYELAGKDAMEGVYAVAVWNENIISSRPSAQKLQDAYMKEYNRKPSEFEIYYYELPYIVKMALDKGATKETLIDVAKTVVWQDAPSGMLSFDSKGDVKDFKFLRCIIKNNAAVLNPDFNK
ncbi:MAG: branched-chain amino acid ABC transporter substrate-binding protein [Clostridiales bacterium]|nr:branched-chain amino acid ABC transporter substrate-binding protein [Clostridiales bacterium]